MLSATSNGQKVSCPSWERNRVLFRTAGRWTQTAALPSVAPPQHLHVSRLHGGEESQPGQSSSRKPKANIFRPEESGPRLPPDLSWWFAFPKSQCFWSPGDVFGGRPRIHLVLGRARNGGQRGQQGIHPSLARKWKLPSQQRGSRGARSTGWPQLFIWQSPPNPESSLEMETPSHIKIGAACLGNAKLPGPM